ncbi:MAG: hypothetical protein ACE15E_20055 [Acidobacteriota bacterium]
MEEATFGSLWRLSRRSFACFAILFALTIYRGLTEWMPVPAAPGLMALVLVARIFVDPFILLLLVARLLQFRTCTDQQLQGSSLLLAAGWLILVAGIVATALRFVYTVTLDQYAGRFGIESPELAPVLEAGSGATTPAVALAGVSLGWIFLSFVPLLSIVAFLKGRGRRAKASLAFDPRLPCVFLRALFHSRSPDCPGWRKPASQPGAAD